MTEEVVGTNIRETGNDEHGGGGQTQLTERALELMALPEDVPCVLLDLGCGSGLSGQVLSERGHTWVVSGAG